MLVVSTEYSQILAANVAKGLDCPLGGVKFSRFPDGEQYLRLSATDRHMVIVGSIPEADALIQILLLVDACEGAEITLVVPYMGYARQDKRFHEGEPLSARVIARVLSTGVSRVLTVNIHDRAVLSHFHVPVRDASLAGEIGRYLEKSEFSSPLVLAPDEGAAAFAGQVAAVCGWETDHLEKTRISGNEVRMAPRNLEAKGRDVVIVDDIISTGGTLATAVAMLKEQGARSVSSVCVHGVLAEGAYARLLSGGVREVACSDTLERACSRYSAAGAVVDGIEGCW